MIKFKDYEKFGIAEVSTSKYHNIHLKKIARYIFYSKLKFIYKVPPLLAKIQVQIARKIGGLEDALRTGEIEISKLQSELPNSIDKIAIQEKIRQYKTNISIHKHLIKEWRWVADGIVWRFLEYKREKIRLLSENANTGYLNFLTVGFKNELTSFIELSTFSWKKALLSDITNCLRTGDIIVRHSEKQFEILEVKSSSVSDSKKKNRPRLERQEERIRKITQVLDTGIVEAQKGKIVFVNCDVPLGSFLEEVASLIQETKSGKCAVVKKLDKVISVVVHNYHRAITLLPKNATEKDIDKLKELMDVDIPKFKNKERIMCVSNFDHFNQKNGEFMRLVPPYTIYPFSANVCSEIISGKILITTWIDLEALKEVFIENGWDVEEIANQKLGEEIRKLKQAKQNNQERYKVISDDTIFILRKNGREVHFPLSILIRMGYEFITTETMLKVAEYISTI